MAKKKNTKNKGEWHIQKTKDNFFLVQKIGAYGTVHIIGCRPTRAEAKELLDLTQKMSDNNQ